MPKGKNEVKTTFQKARQTPSKRRATSWASPVKTPKGLTPLTAYIEENRAEGITVRELIEQFREYDCDHPDSMQHVVASGAGYQHVYCTKCTRIEKRTPRGGVMDDE